MVRFCFSSLIFVAALILVSVDAKAAVMPCDGCSDFSMEDMAKYAGDGEHVVYDVSSGKFHRYYVSGWGESEINFGQEVSVVRIPTTQFEQESINELRDFSLVYGSPLAASVDVYIQDMAHSLIYANVTPYDVVSDANIRFQIEERVETAVRAGSSFNSSVQRIFELAEGLFGAPVSVGADITLHFADGGRATFRKTTKFGKYTYVPGTARYSNGQVVIEANTPAYSGMWHFSGGNSVEIDDFVASAADVGARWLGVVPGGDDSVTIICNWKPLDGLLECQVVM